MLVISNSIFRGSQKQYYDLAQKERVLINRKSNYFELVPCGHTIPDNPSPSNDRVSKPRK